MSEAPPPLYHGTRRPFRPGGVLLPRSAHGGAGTSAPLNPGRAQPADADQWVYLTADPLLAWVYAWHAPGRGKPRVLTVTTRGAVEMDPEHGASMRAVRAEWAAVTAVSAEPMITEDDAHNGWQSTLDREQER